MAPEVVRGGPTGHDFAVDWWSVGVLTYELLTGASPFTVEGERNTQAEISRRILKSHPPIPDYLSPAVQDFIRRLLVKDTRRRLGGGHEDALELKRHPFFRDIDWNLLASKKIPAPFVPKISGELDVSNFADEFTSMVPIDPESPAVTNSIQDEEIFKGYSYISPSILFSQNIISDDIFQKGSTGLNSNNIKPVGPLRPEINDLTGSQFGKSAFFESYCLKVKDGFLGDGSFSVVRKCVHKKTGITYAVKIISRRVDSSREILMLKTCADHPNIVKLIETLEDDYHTYLILELLSGGELLERIRKKSSFTESEAGHIFRGLVSSVHYMHSKGIVHRDLKPEVIALPYLIMLCLESNVAFYILFYY